MNVLLRAMIRASFYPTLAISRAMEAMGLWRRWDWVDDSFLLGAWPARGDFHKLRALGITGIVNLCEQEGVRDQDSSSPPIDTLHLPTVDYHSPLMADVFHGLDFIKNTLEHGGKIYVHCKAGRGRSATLAICYLLVRSKMTPEEAYAKVKSARPQIDGRLAHRSVVKEIHHRVVAGEL